MLLFFFDTPYELSIAIKYTNDGERIIIMGNNNYNLDNLTISIYYDTEGFSCSKYLEIYIHHSSYIIELKTKHVFWIKP
jgi:hypothetical protein